MKKIKNLFKSILSASIIVSMLIACGGGGKKIDIIKLIPVKAGKDFQYVDLEGKIVINPQFAQATVFRNGLALVKTSGDNPKWGFIGEDGKYVIAATYKSATVFGDGLAWVVSENGAPTCISTKGEVKFTLQNAEEVNIFSEGLAGFMEVNDEGKQKWGFVDKEGKVKINAQFNQIRQFVNGKCAVKNNEGKWGYIDKDGKILINYQFDEAENYDRDFAVVSSGGKYGVIDGSGRYKINPQYSGMTSDGSLFLIEQDGKYGWTDKEGKIVINPQFSRALPFGNESLAAIQSNKKSGFVDKEGKIVINPQFDDALPFNGKFALVESSDKWGLIDKEGKYIVNPQFDGISQDLVYLLDGSSRFDNVETDFFNIGAITSRLKFDAPEGLTFSNTMSTILSKFKKSQDDFSKYSKEHKVISSEKITNDASLDFYILGEPWVESGFYDYTFNNNATPYGFAYIVNLSGKGLGKADAVKSAIEQSLKDYTKDESKSSTTESYYTNSKQSVIVFTKDGNVVVVMNSQTASQNATQSPAVADSTAKY